MHAETDHVHATRPVQKAPHVQEAWPLQLPQVLPCGVLHARPLQKRA